MKKLLFAAVIAAAAFAFSSCGNSAGCYEITYKVMETEVTVYFYGTPDQVDVYVETLGQVADVTRNKVDKNASDCAAANMGM